MWRALIVDPAKLILVFRDFLWKNNLYNFVCITDSFIIDYKVIRIETVDGIELTDLKAPPPDTVYVVGIYTS